MIEIDKIYNEDCLEGMKRMPDNMVDAVITSPPYNYNLRIHYGEYGGRSVNDHNKYGKMFKDDLPMEEYFKWQRDCIAEMLRISKGPVFYNIQMLTGNKAALCQILGHFAAQVKEIIIWDKINAEPAMHDGVLNSMWEFVIVFDKTDAIARQFKVFNAERGKLANMLRINKNTNRQNINHNAVFPLLLPQTLVHYFTPMGGGNSRSVHRLRHNSRRSHQGASALRRLRVEQGVLRQGRAAHQGRAGATDFLLNNG